VRLPSSDGSIKLLDRRCARRLLASLATTARARPPGIDQSREKAPTQYWVSLSSIPLPETFSPMPSSIRNSLVWIFDAFERDSTFVQKQMFGCAAAYLDGLLCLIAADRGEPWNGLLVCTSKERHAALIADMPALQPHPVLGKWLYISQNDPAFEITVEQMTTLVMARDERVGVEPKPRKRRGKLALPKT
jgi:hypothetical protein